MKAELDNNVPNRYISKGEAIARIIAVTHLAANDNGKTIVLESYEPDYNIDDFIASIASTDIDTIYEWTNSMLADKVNEPFIRYSMLDKYRII